MKFRVLVAALMLVALGAMAAQAADVKSEFGLNAGVSLPTGDFSDGASTGFFGGGTYTYHVNEMFGVGGDVNYHKFGKKDVTVLATTVSSEASVVQYGVHGKYFVKLKTNEMPYLKVGLGMYSLSVKGTVNGNSNTASDTKFGFNVGAGADWKLNDKTTWGVEALYHNIQGDNGSSANLITVGLRYGWLMN